MKLTIVKSSVYLALYLGILILLPGPALAALNDHHSPDGNCNGVPEPPNPAGTPCEQKLCTNDGDWMCCKRCTASGGICSEQIATSSSKGSGIRVPGGRLQKKPDMTTTAPSIMMPRTDTKTPIMRRGVEGEQTTEPASENANADHNGEHQHKRIVESSGIPVDQFAEFAAHGVCAVNKFPHQGFKTTI